MLRCEFRHEVDSILRPLLAEQPLDQAFLDASIEIAKLREKMRESFSVFQADAELEGMIHWQLVFSLVRGADHIV